MSGFKTWVCNECAGGTVCCYHTSTAEPLLCTLGAPYVKWRELEDEDIGDGFGQHMIRTLINESNID
jgi:hypothetical protein